MIVKYKNNFVMIEYEFEMQGAERDSLAVKI